MNSGGFKRIVPYANNKYFSLYKFHIVSHLSDKVRYGMLLYWAHVVHSNLKFKLKLVKLSSEKEMRSLIL